MKTFKQTLQVLLIAGSAFALAACEQGPAENAGEKVDEMTTDAGNALEDACEDVKEGVNADDKDC